jgi:hypothetical protein
VKNLVNWQYLLCTETWRHSKLVRRSYKIRREKHHGAFMKVVEASEIYNFPIHHLVHFSCKNLSFYRSNRASPNKFRVDCDVAPRPRARRSPWRSGRRPAPLGWLHDPRLIPRSHARPEATSKSSPSSRRAAGRALDGLPDGLASPLPCTPAEAGACS